jgi:predicted GNAT family acetyltransferase
MDVIRHSDPRAFAELAFPLYEADPVRHTTALTVLDSILSSERDDVLMITVVRDGAVAACAFRTPPWPLIASALPVGTHRVVQDFFVGNGIPLGGVLAPREVADPFVTLWTEMTGQAPDYTLGLRLHRLGQFTPRTAPGRFHPVEPRDIDLIGEWWAAFEEEESGGLRRIDGHAEARRAMENPRRRFGLWLDEGGIPVSMAGGSVPLNGMSRLGPVYTPKEHRGRGYGSAVTTALTRWALDDGARDVLLYTDVTNPVSNAIYHRIGYRPVLEAVEHRVPDANTLRG